MSKGWLADTSPLTVREQDVARFLVAGLTAREISSELEISFHTVRSHIRSLYFKTGVTNRVELVHWQAERESIATTIARERRPVV
jgi:DNA-binding CsgD family transcriptional regulator